MGVMFFLLAINGSPWDVPTISRSPWSVPNAIPVVQSGVQEPKWTIWEGDNSDPYKDVHSRVKNAYNDVHEASHQASNILNNKWGGYSSHKYAIYCMKGRCTAIPEPPITIAQVAVAVPKEKRRDGYQLYLIDQQRYWNNNPIYLLEEATCYSNEWDYDHTDIGLRHAVAFCDYADTLLSLAEKCPGYDCTKLRTFILWHKDRVQKQQEEAKKRQSAKPISKSDCPTGTCPNTFSSGSR